MCHSGPPSGARTTTDGTIRVFPLFQGISDGSISRYARGVSAPVWRSKTRQDLRSELDK